MSRYVHNLTLELDEDLSEKLQYLQPDYGGFRILRQSVDARRKLPRLIYSLEVFEHGEKPQPKDFKLDTVSFPRDAHRPLIIGSGPAGLFAALRFVDRGIPCTLIERGSQGLKRIQAINKYWKHGDLDQENNVCFGEGGAGLYSDGKLITRIKSPYIPYVMKRMVDFGAPEEIEYLSNPHVGSNRIRRIIPKICEYLISKGCDLHFETRMTDFILSGSNIKGIKTNKSDFYSDHIVLATGHSADDVFDLVKNHHVALEGKSFAVGLRVEHPQALINRLRYREASDHPKLGAANYRLASTDKKSGLGVYSFCMCPGGYILSSGTSANGVVSNGMSNYSRNSPFANAAIVVTVDHAKNFGTDVFGGMKFRDDLESSALKMVQSKGGHHQMPAQRVIDFMNGKEGEVLKTSCPSGVVASRLDKLFSVEMREAMSTQLEQFDRQMPGFISDAAQFHGVESRTSCPVRILRDPTTLQSVSHHGLYPTGEGAGYAGGITSAACDGIRVAESIMSELSSSVLIAQ